MNIPPLSLLIGGALLAGCAPQSTVRERTLPAAFQPTYTLATFAVTPPADPAWRLADRNRDLSWLWLVHADHKAFLGAAWQPVFQPGNAAGAGRDAAEKFLRDEIFKQFEASPDYRVDSQQSQPDDTLDDRLHHRWELQLTRLGTKTQIVYQVTVLVHAAPARPDLFIYVLAVPQTAAAHHDACREVLRQIAHDSRPSDYAPVAVALPRLQLAAAAFFELADTEQKDRPADAQTVARENLRVAAEQARDLLPAAPHPWNILGRLAEYNADGLRYGVGFDPTAAEQHYRAALERRASFAAARENLASLYEFLDRPADAEREWLAAIETEPSQYDYHYRLGRFLQKQNRQPEALASFREALRFWRGAEITRQELQKEVKTLARQSGEK